MTTAGGYDEGYRSCPCFWGDEPGSLIKRIIPHVPSTARWRVLDAGCGEGKNAIFLARLGMAVVAIDVSEAAIHNARSAWPDADLVEWHAKDITEVDLSAMDFDLVVAYGLLHCLETHEKVLATVKRLKECTRAGGYNVVCAFNSRSQDLSAHPGFQPVLLSHSDYLGAYRDWTLLEESDRDLHETHPHNNIPHTHSMTRLITRRPFETDDDDQSAR